MAYFDYGYFSFSQKRIDKFDPKVERKKLVKKRTIINKLLANEMGKEFYDGKRINGYAGFKYDGRWKIFLKKIIKKYKLNNKSKVLDIGAKKGFFMHDLKKLLPGIKIYGVEDHYYPISKSMSSVFSAEKIHLWLTDSVIIVLLFFNILNRIQEYSIQ